MPEYNENAPHQSRDNSSIDTLPSSALKDEDAAIVARLRDAHDRVKKEMAKVIVGQEEIVDGLLIALLGRGHVLLLGVPGLGKTLIQKLGRSAMKSPASGKPNTMSCDGLDLPIEFPSRVYRWRKSQTFTIR